MPAATQISINDATPTAHLFDPVGKTPSGSVLYVNNTDASTSATAENMSLALFRANGQRSINRVKINFSVPYAQTVDGAVEVRSTARANIDVIIPDDATASEREDFMAMLSNLFDATDVKNHVEDLTPTW